MTLVSTMRVATLSVCLGACSIFTDLKGFSEPDRPTDAHVRADSSEPALEDDGGGVARVDATVEDTSCDATFCDNFGRDSLLGDWTKSENTSASTLFISRAERGGFLAARVRPNSDTPSVGAWLYLASAPQPSKDVSYAFDIRIDALPAEPVQTCSMTIDFAPNVYTNVVLMMRPSGVSVIEQSFGGTGPITFKEHAISSTFAPGMFHHVEMRLDFGVAPTTLSADLDGARIVNVGSATNIVPGKIVISAGARFANPTARLDVDVDNVRIDVH